MSVLSFLRNPDVLLDSITRLLARNALHGLDADLLRNEARAVAARVANDVRKGQHVARPARLHWAMLDKRRELYSFELADAILHDAFANWLALHLEASFSPQLFSYRRGRSAYLAIESFLSYLQAHRRRHPDPRRRGLFVVRCDIKSYGDSMLMGRSSPLWDELLGYLGPLTDYERGLVESLVRPTVLRPDCGEATPLRGLPTGSPLGPVLGNLYLMPIDAHFAGTDLFYARFGDDILFAHESVERVDAAVTELSRRLSDRGLQLAQHKLQRIFLNGAARPSPAPEFRGAASFVYLGWQIQFSGTIGLPRDKMRSLLLDLRQRIRLANRLLEGLPPPERARELVAIVGEALDERSPMATHYAAWLRSSVSDRGQLAQLDYLVARAIAAALSPRPGVRAFRDMPYSALRHDLGLPSLVARRNRGPWR